MKFLRTLLCLFLAFLTACNGASSTAFAPSTAPVASPTGAVLTPAGEMQTPSALPSLAPPPDGPITLRVWMPPQFDPSGDTPAAQILHKRLDQFSKRRPGVSVEVRIKAVTGPGGLLNTLITASAAAPEALPDLIALPRDLLEPAALKGLLYPFDTLSQVMEDGDWYDYGRDLAQLQQSVYGLPFAGDTLALVYRPSSVSQPPVTWEAVLAARKPLIFAAADPLAPLTLALYQASGGPLHDEQGRPAIDPAVLTQVLTLYAQSENAQIMPEWLTQFQTDDQVWQAYQQKRADQVITWTSRYLNSAEVDDQAIGLLPTQDGKPYTVAAGWVWALAARSSARQALAVELAEFLTESSFMAGWTSAAGYLPPRPSALKHWGDSAAQAAVEPLALAAQVLSPADVVIALSNPFWQASVDVLKRKNDPLTAAQAAAASLVAPPK